jgi:protein TonB
MRASDSALTKAIALSVLLHALPFAAGVRPLEATRSGTARPAAQLEVTLRPVSQLEETPLTPSAAPASSIEVAYAAKEERGARAVKASSADEPWQSKIKLSRELLYPPEAIARGLEGDATVMLFLDESGDAIAARLESSTGHVLLDAAAVRAVGSLRGLPESAPREILLPVRFRLK